MTVKETLQPLQSLPAWKALTEHQKTISNQRMSDWFTTDPNRFNTFSEQLDGLLFDYSKNRITTTTRSLLIRLAEESHLQTAIENLFTGQPINCTENRPALHTALRAPYSESVMVNGRNVMSDIQTLHNQMRFFIETVRKSQWLGATGKPIRDIVNIGIGGSDLGPRMAVHALSSLATKGLHCYFISDVDASALDSVLQQVDPERVLFIVSSKSFTTPETTLKAASARQWLQDKLQKTDVSTHFVAVTAAGQKALNQGIPENQIFPLWDWVGGRYSVWSAIGLPLALMVGMPHFEDFLRGAHSIDLHFRQTDFENNIPVLMALLGVWNIDFQSAHSQVIAPYADELRLFRDHIQQLDMESNGKRINTAGDTVDYATGPVILGEAGCDSQHSFFQSLHQGPAMIPVDFILQAKRGQHHVHHDMLVGSALSQAQALMLGKSEKQAYQELIQDGMKEAEAAWLAKHKTLPGNRPSNVLFIDELTPYRLGQLIALYEHKIFVQGVIWQINSFDQWGVELGKQLLPTILQALSQGEDLTADSSTQGLIHYFRGRS